MEGLLRTSMDEKMISISEYQESEEGERMKKLLKLLHDMAEMLLRFHDINCSQCFVKHFQFQCGYGIEHIIATYHKMNHAHLGMKEIEQLVAYMAATKMDSFIDARSKNCSFTTKLKCISSFLLKTCIENFSDNAYVLCYENLSLAAQESTNILQEEDDKSLSLGMPMQPQEEDKEEQV
jgi:hypothetical protein